MLAGVALNIVFPEAFSAGGPPPWLQAVSAVVLAVGVVAWAWSVLLILTKVRAGELTWLPLMTESSQPARRSPPSTSPRPGPGGQPVLWRVYRDPAGHPFCLVIR